MPDELAGHLWVEGPDGQRLLDANKAAGVPMSLHLPPGPATLVLADARWSRGPDGRFAPLPPEAEPVARRGTLADQFRERLFLRPLTREFVAGFDAGTQAWTAAAPVPPRGPWYDDALTLTLLGGGAAGLIAGAITTPFYLSAADDADRRPVTSATEDAAARATRPACGTSPSSRSRRASASKLASASARVSALTVTGAAPAASAANLRDPVGEIVKGGHAADPAVVDL